MPPDIDQLFQSLRADSGRAPLAGPERLREAAETRTRQRRAAVIAISAAAVVAIAIGSSALSLTQSAPDEQIGVDPKPTASATAQATEPPATGEPTATVGSAVPPTSSSSPAQSGPVSCTPNDFNPTPAIQSEGAMGTAYTTVTMSRRGTGTCALKTYPSLLYTDSKGNLKPLPATREEGLTQNTVLVGPRDSASFTVATSTGCHFEPGSPQCANPTTYTGIWVLLDNGRRLKLPGVSIFEPEPGIRLRPWS